MATVRAIVSDVEAAAAFYCTHLGFQAVQRFGAAMAIVAREDVRLWLAGPTSSAARPMPDGARPAPGGWLRLVLTTDDLDGLCAQLRAAGVTFRTDPIAGPGGRQALIEDPSGNPIELFEPA